MAVQLLYSQPVEGELTPADIADRVRRARQLRTVLEHCGAHQLTACLAIPSYRPGRASIDWMTDDAEPARSWGQLPPAARRQALALLRDAQRELMQQLEQLSARSPQSPWLPMLRLALHFTPGHGVMLAGSQPIVCGWGGVDPRALGPEDPLDTLDMGSEAVRINPMIESDVTTSRKAEPPVQVSYWKPPPKPTAAQRWGRHSLWLIPLMLAVGAIAGGLPGRLPLLTSEPVTAQPAAPVNLAVHQTPNVVALKPLPLAQAQVVTPTPPDEPAAPAPSASSRLVMPEAAVKRGQLSFLNGVWRIDTRGQRGVSTRYQLQGSGGLARLTLAEGVTCRAPLYSGLLPSGTLKIKSRSPARCSDGSRHPLPEIACKASADRSARCQMVVTKRPQTVTLTRVTP